MATLKRQHRSAPCEDTVGAFAASTPRDAVTRDAVSDETMLRRAAVAYATRLGWPVFPLAPQSKVPAIRGGSGSKSATTDRALIDRWWGSNRRFNVGLATGSPSGFFVVDVDPRSGGDRALEQLEQKHGALPETAEAKTGGGGRHLLYRMVPALAAIRWSPLARGLDLKGTGGYIVAPPSIHPNGQMYAWEVSHRPFEMPVSDPPAWLVALMADESRRTATGQNAVAPIRPGGRNAALTRVGGALRRHGVEGPALAAALAAINGLQCDPPLSAREVAAIAKSIGRYEPSTSRWGRKP